MKRLFLIALIAVLVCGLAVATGGTEEAMQEAEPYEFGFWFGGTSEAEGDYWEAFFEEFLAGRDDMVVTPTGVPWSDYITKLNVAFASGTAPDIAHYPIASISQRASLGQFRPLDDYYATWDGKDDYIENLYELGEYKGSLYGLVTFTDPRLLVWRKDLFEEAGLDPDVPPSNWEELAEYAIRLTKKENGQTVQGGMEIPVQNSYMYVQVFALQNGGQLVDIEANDPAFDSPQVIEAAKFLQDLVLQGVNISYDDLAAGDNPFVLGKTAMNYSNPTGYRNLVANNPEMEELIGVAPPLSRRQEGTFCGARLLYMSSETEVPDLAWEVIEAAMTVEEARERYELFYAPVNRKSLLDWFIEEDPVLNTATIQAVQVGQGVPKIPWHSQLNRAVSTAMERAFYGEDVETVFKEQADKLREEVADFQLGN